MSDEGVVSSNVGAAVGGIEHVHTVNQMETAKSTEGIFELPCGYLDVNTQEVIKDVQIREITGREEDMLASSRLSSTQKISSLLTGCVVRIGVVTDKGHITRIVQNLTVGDRFFLIFAIRRVTLGDDFPVRERCPECGVKTLFMVDLGEDLTVRSMPDPSRRLYDVVLPSSGVLARFKVSTGMDEERLAKIRKHNKNMDALSQGILMRLELLGDEKPTLRMVQDLGMRDRHYLREQFQSVEGGVDTTLELECPSCGNEWEKELDLGGTGFFFPGGRRRS